LFKTLWIPQIGATYLVSENTSVKVNVSKGYRSPTINELFMFKAANPGLDPEKMWNYEAGVMHKLLKQKLSLDLTCFYINGNNLIEMVGVFPDVQYLNTGAFKHYGLEFQGKYLVIKGLDILLNYSWLHTNKPVLAAPEHMAFLESNYKVRNFMFNLSLQYINHLTTQISPLTTESYALLSARISYTVDNFVTFYIDANNLADQEYEINYGYPMPGVSVMGGGVVNFLKKI
jgi:iron complex outermembrane receptor protein